MSRLAYTLLTLCLGLCLAAQGAETLTRDESRAVLKEFEALSNLNPAAVEAEAPVTLERLRAADTPVHYFIACNIYAENLFNQGHVDKARRAVAAMIDEAFALDDAESRVIALRAQGQFYYKVGLYERAADCFRRAMEMCPAYDSGRLESVFTWSSTLFWLVQADLHTGHLEEADLWLERMDAMMQWLDANGPADRVGYKPVMLRGLKAKAALERGDTARAAQLLDECPQYMLADVPERAYVEYYVGRMRLLVQQERHAEALPLLDRLVDMHLADYKPIAAEYLYQKGLSLAALGRHAESSRALAEYIKLKAQADEVAVGQQLDELTTRYEVERLQHERDNMRRQLAIVLAVCLALAVIITLIIINQRKLNHKNQTLARNISELNRLTREGRADAAPAATEPGGETGNAGLAEVGREIADYINTTQCYLRADCSRDTIKEGLGVSERTLAKAIVAATGLSFVNYINRLRLNVSIDMLEEKPDMTISDISRACGFGTVRQFQRIFKQHYDLSPSAYRDARSGPDADGDGAV